MTGKKEREQRVREVTIVDQEVAKVSKAEVGRAVGPDDIPVEVWKCVGGRVFD